ncbi:putative transcription initiation protein [Trypanosoma cruzi]|uniref:Transcription initiation protein, putative n=2 Tax=Trypanosoma cruzi TaxID=5693 RepID=Q4DTT9_TRYCC|nr:transcription initiation protein, putative [Trypanosoma cruzi]EAN95926.1 transcription initiation protein, putative [Trypanosoma cruzi]PWV05227.1 putative transcription initiation protein [Trypanosoma cruzi]|eukprot:XP_817777.1 transcription initiation protein [Trypanosoma cruzi strain CL Brener]
MAEELNVSELADLLGDDELLDVTSPLVAVLPQSATSAELDGKDVGSKKKHKRKGKRLRHEKKHRKLSEIEESNESEDDNNETPRKRSKYVIDAAESGDSESEGDDFIVGSDEEDEDGDYVGGIPTYEPRKTHIFREGEENMTSEELARAIEERHRASKKEGGKTETLLLAGLGKGNMSSLRYTSHLLPQDTDPRVFAVKCRPRMARLLVARIVNKCYAYRIGRNYEKRKVDLGIISVFCLDHVKEYIYIEAHRKVFVENALNGLDGLFRYKITLVNPSELMQMMERRPSPEKLRVGSFVRLRQRQYRLDLAQVVEVHPISNQVTVKVVPREDFVGKPFKKIEIRLPPRFFVPTLAAYVQERGDFYRWGDLTFDKEGYLLKTVSSRMVISGTKMKNPTVEEIALFFNNDRERVREAVARFASVGHRGADLRIGNTVRVVSGQLRETVGTIENIFLDTNTVSLSCPVPGRKEPIKVRVELAACVKHFALGTHVIVSSGERAGESGTVVNSSGDVVYIFSDRATASRELTVCASDCHQSNLIGSFGHTSGSWRLFDLVMLADTSSVGCIVRINRNDICVLTDRSETRYLSPMQIKAAVASPRQTMDRLNNIVTRGAEVIIQTSPNTPYHLVGQTGRVEQLFGSTLFVRVRSVKENAGLVVLDARSVLLIGGRTSTKHIQQPKQLPAVQLNPHNATKGDVSVPHPRLTSEDWATNSEWYEIDAS